MVYIKRSELINENNKLKKEITLLKARLNKYERSNDNFRKSLDKYQSKPEVKKQMNKNALAYYYRKNNKYHAEYNPNGYVKPKKKLKKKIIKIKKSSITSE